MRFNRFACQPQWRKHVDLSNDRVWFLRKRDNLASNSMLSNEFENTNICRLQAKNMGCLAEMFAD